MQDSPFKFLDSYTREDAGQFFGREEETHALFRRQFETNLILLYGLSGTGKTSLVQCGLANRYADTDWLPLFVRRGNDNIASLNARIHEAAIEKTMVDGQPISRQVESLYLDYYKPIHLIFDQFEELFILGSKDEADRFFWLLAELLKARLQVKIILIMREEYLAELDRFERIVPTLFENRFRVERMRREDIQRVIAKSVAHFRIELEEPAESLIERIAENLLDERGRIDLANLQVYLDRLYREDDRRRGSTTRPIRFDGSLVETAGALTHVLGRFLSDQVAMLDVELRLRGVKKQEPSLSVLAQLVTIQGTKQPRSVSAMVDQLQATSGLNAEDVIYCIERLQAMRIIRYLEEA